MWECLLHPPDIFQRNSYPTAAINCCCCSVSQLCSTLCDTMDCSMSGFPVLHHLPELAQTHIQYPALTYCFPNLGQVHYSMSSSNLLLNLHIDFWGGDLCLKNYGRSFVTLYRRQQSSPRKRQNGCLTRPYKYLWKEERLKAKEKRKDIPIWMQSYKE